MAELKENVTLVEMKEVEGKTSLQVSFYPDKNGRWHILLWTITKDGRTHEVFEPLEGRTWRHRSEAVRQWSNFVDRMRLPIRNFGGGLW